MTLDFGGYGGEYCIGKLTDREVENIKILLNRFDIDVFFNRYDMALDTDHKENFYEYSDVYQAWTVCSDFLLSFQEENEYLNISDYQSEFRSIQYPKEKGWYVNSCSSEKGHFFTVSLPIDSEDFDEEKLKIIYDDLSLTWLNDEVISGVEYDGEELDMDFDSADTNGKGFYQHLTFIDEDGNQFNGLEIILDELEPKYNVLDDVDSAAADTNQILFDYLSIYHNELTQLDSPIVYHSPLLYDKRDKEEVDKMWYNQKEIKTALKLGLADEIPKHIIEKMQKENPEWLI